MELKEVIETIRMGIDNGCGHMFLVNVPGRGNVRMRLFATEDGNVAEYKKNCRRWGFQVNVSSWLDIKPVLKDKYRTFKHNCERICKYLDASGLWTEINAEVKSLLKLDEKTVTEIADCHDFKKMEAWFRDNKVTGMSLDNFYTLFVAGSVKTIRSERYSTTRERIDEAIKNKIKFHESWRNSYDCSVEYNPEKNMAWYAEEYKNCGNGYYWLLLDNCHCAFCEPD